MILDAMLSIRSQLEAAGLRATIDSKSVNPPCILIQPPVVNYRFGAKCPGAEWTLLAVGPNSSDKIAEVRALDELIDATRTALHGAPVTARPAGVFTADGTATLPAYELTFTDKLEVI